MTEIKQDAEKESLSILKRIPALFVIIGSIIGLIIHTCFLAIVSIGERFWHIDNVHRVDKKQFWQNVFKCLMEFHGMSYERATQLAGQKYPIPVSNTNKVYLQEPFKVANEIAGFEVELSIVDYKKRYLKQILGHK